jgi:ABC-type nitrate/sulfonate/bicarbonate transport system ATPase subunit
MDFLQAVDGRRQTLDARQARRSGVIVKFHPEITVIFQDGNLPPWRALLKSIALPFELTSRKPDMERREAPIPADPARGVLIVSRPCQVFGGAT